MLTDSNLVRDGDHDQLRSEVGSRARLTAAEIVALDIPVRNRVETRLVEN